MKIGPARSAASMALSDFPAPLGDTDRCDACGARGVAQAVLAKSSSTSERLLVFCGHHLQVHGQAIVARGGVLIVPRSDPEVPTARLPR